MTGIRVADDVVTEHAVTEIRFLGCTVQRKGRMHTVDQISYIEERRLGRGYDKVAGKKHLPDLQEGRAPPVDRADP